MKRYASIALLTTVAALGMTATARADEGAALTRGETLLQLNETVTEIVPIGSIETSCSISGKGETEAKAQAALARERAKITAQLTAVGAQTSAATFGAIEIGTETVVGDDDADADMDHEAKVDVAKKAAEAAVAAAAEAATGRTDYSSVSFKEWPTATQQVTIKLASFHDFSKVVRSMANGECDRTTPIISAANESTVIQHAQLAAMANARKRADMLATGMNMKVTSLRRVQEQEKSSTPSWAEFVAMMMTNGRDLGRLQKLASAYEQNKVPVTVRLNVDFILAPK